MFDVITVGSGTDALLISLLSLNLKEDDEVILPSFSWLSVIEVVLLLKLKPVFVDTNIKDFNLDVSQISNLISKKTKVVISTSLFGRTCDLNSLKKAIEGNNKRKLFNTFKTTRNIRTRIIEAGQDINQPNFGRKN